MPQLSDLTITGLGMYVPEKVLTNADLESMVETNDEWITSRTGIKERRLSAPDQATSDLALKAAEQALAQAQLAAEDIDLIVIGTVSPDMLFPATACVLQAKLGANKAVCFDLSAACSGMLYSLDVVKAMAMAGPYKNILVISADELTKYTDYEDRNTCILFGDGACAMVLQVGTDKPGYKILGTKLESDGTGGDFLKIPAGGSLAPVSDNVLKERSQYIYMNGREVFKLAVTGMSQISQNILEQCGLTSDDIRLVVPHQANKRIIDSVVKKLKVDDDRVFINVDKYGNTSGASVGLALKESEDAGLIKHDDALLLVTFGAGFTAAATVLRYQT